jgi:hypothetical protein
MAMVGMYGNYFWANDPDETGNSYSITFEFPPRFTVAQVSVTATVAWDTPAVAQSWISEYRCRLRSAADQTVDVSDTAPGMIAVDQCTSVTYFVNTYAANCTALANALFFE